MRIFDANVYALLLNTHIYGGTKHAYICVQNTLIFAYETPIYLRTSELCVLLAGITNSTQRILIRKLGEKQSGMVSYCKILYIKVKNIRQIRAHISRTHFETNSQPYMYMLSFSSASVV